MVQTLADMLDAQPDAYGRDTVWLRAIGELPLSIIHEHYNNAGEIAMSALTKLSNKKLRLVAILLVVLIVLGVAAVERRAIVAGVASLYYHRQLQGVMDEQNNALGDPADLFNVIKREDSNDCSPFPAGRFPIVLDCAVTAYTYAKLGETDADRSANIAKAAKLEQALATAGYDGGSNGVSVTSLIGGVYEGKDYSPDAFYQKTVGSYICVFDLSIAYSNPAPKAVNTNLTCSRTVNVVGSIPQPKVLHK